LFEGAVPGKYQLAFFGFGFLTWKSGSESVWSICLPHWFCALVSTAPSITIALGRRRRTNAIRAFPLSELT
jgi:hypothetical protein